MKRWMAIVAVVLGSYLVVEAQPGYFADPDLARCVPRAAMSGTRVFD